MKAVNKAIRKKDAMQLLLGKPVYTDDIAPDDCLIVKLLRSPYANAVIKDINADIAMKVPGIEAVFTYKDIDQNMKRFTCAGFDPKRDQTVDPVLWEIRRERIVELMGEGFGFYDVRRWKKAPWFINKIQYGQWATKEQIGDSGQFVDLEKGYADTTGKKEGFIYMYNDPLVAGKGWLDKYYLYQVPTNEIALNPELAPNNPGWE